MLKIQDSAIVKVRNNTTATLCGIAAGATEIKFLNLTWFNTYGVNIYTAMNAGNLTGIDILGTDIPAYKTPTAETLIQTDASNFYQEASVYADWPALLMAHKIHWNLNAVHCIMDCIGTDMLSADWTSLGITKASVLTKVQGVYDLVEQGMFTEASAATLQLTTDTFLTTAKLSLYSSMLLSADAFSN